MKKIFLTLSIAAAMAIPAITSAQTKTSETNGKTQTVTTCPVNCQPQCNPQGCPQCNPQGCPMREPQCNPACAPQCRPGCAPDSAYCGRQAYGKRHGGNPAYFKGPRYGKQAAEAGKFRNGAPRQNMLLNGIQLTEEQQQQMKAFNEKQKADRQKQKAEANAKKTKERQERMEAYDKEMKKILTPEQFKQYEANKSMMSANRPQGKGNRPSPKE